MPDYYRQAYAAVDAKTTRKPGDWDDIPAWDFTKEEQGLLFGRLPVYEWNDPDAFPLDPLWADTEHDKTKPQRLMLNFKGKTFYVNTEGHNYPRYIVEVGTRILD